MFKPWLVRFFAPEDGSGSEPTGAPATDADIVAAVLAPVEDKVKPKQPKEKVATEETPPQTKADAPRGATEEGTDPLESDDSDAQAGIEGEIGGEPDEDADEFNPFENTETSTQEQSSEVDEGDDAVVYQVTVDGEPVDVTLGELKRRYSGEGAIEKRLQIATKTKQEAEAEREAAAKTRREVEEHASASREQLAHAITALRSVLMQPRIKQPDPALRNSNPAKYVADLEAFNAERAMLQQRGAQLDTILQAHQQTQAQEYAERRQREAQMLLDKMPVFKDPEKGKKTLEMIQSAARSVGFTDQEVAAAADHRLFVLATKAAMYDRIVSKAGGKKTTALKQSVVPAKGSANSNPKNPVRVQAAKQAALVRKAAETGDVDDIAATLLVPKRK